MCEGLTDVPGTLNFALCSSHSPPSTNHKQKVPSTKNKDPSPTSGCGVTSASESWELVATVRLCPPRPKTPLAARDELGRSQYRNAVASGRPRRRPWHTKAATRRYRVTVLTSSNLDCEILRSVISGSDVAGNMRVFQTRLESSNLSFRSN